VEEIEKAKGRVRDLGGRVRRLLAADVHAFVLESVRERFIASPDFADGLGDAQVGALKRAAAHDADAAADLVGELLPDAVWLAARVPEDEARDVRSLPEVAGALDRARGVLTALFERHGLPGEAPPYVLPVRFIEGDDLVSLTRNLWKAVARLESATAARSVETRAADAETRRRRWEGA